MNGLFVTGTDTGIGKTAVSALLLAELRRRVINAAPMKPVQTGCLQKPEGGQESEFQDCRFAAAASRQPHFVSGFKFQVSPLSVPDLD